MDADFCHQGAIVRIKLQNFMTYDQVELHPGPSLNMILGPNGTGKSAIVCCVIVGLAGDVNLTGRGGSPADFVNKHKDFAVTEIELYNNRGANFVIYRKITITARSQHKIDHKSEWKINGKTSLKSDVQQLIRNLNVKVDNLCQFLPQDSVTQFVKMNTFELLHNTLKAAGDSKLVEDHKTLVDKTEEIEKINSTLEGLRKSSKENEVNAKRLQAEVELVNQRKKLMEEKKICDQKIHYIKFLEAQQNLQRARKERERVTRELKSVEESCEPFRLASESHKSKLDSLRQAVNRSEDELKNINSVIQNYNSSIDNCKVSCQEEFARFRGKRDQENQRENSMLLKQQELDSYECRLNEIREVDCSRQIRLVEDEIKKISETRKEVQKERSAAEDTIRQCVAELDEITREGQQIRAVKEKKSNLLRVRFQDAFRVLEWLSKNESKFSKKVYPPIMCEINVKDPKYSRIVEHAIPRQDMCAFVCQTTDDLKTFTRSIRDALNIRFNVVLAPDVTVEQFENEASQGPNLSNLGVKAYLKDLIDAPEPIMRYLCGNHNFHRTPIADSCSEQQLKQLLNVSSKFYVGSSFYHVTKSRYDQQAMTVSDSVRDAQLLLYSLDTNRLNQNQLRYEEAQKRRTAAANHNDELLRKDDELKREWQSASERFRDLKVKHDEKKRLATCVQLARDSIEKLKNERIDIQAERNRLKQSIDKINSKLVKNLEGLTEAYQQLSDLRSMNMKNLLLMRLASKNHKLADKKYKAAQKDTTRLREELKKMENNVRTFKLALCEVRTICEEKIPTFKDDRVDDELEEKFDKIPENTVAELSDKRENLAMRIERIYTESGNAILKEYEKQKEELNEKLKNIEASEEELVKLRSECSRIKETWLPELNEVIKVIDNSYRDFMRKLGYDGQVKLDFNVENPENYALYGIMIMVKYRDDEQLIPLSSTRQSGGERSVATMIYMLALQTKTTVPFRCVDEINQGMDKTNERRVFELLVKTADSSSSQYFLVSPKLLPDLSYSSKMRIHIIFNGRGLDRNIKL